MSCPRKFLLLGALFVCLTISQAQAGQKPRSVSTSRQFLVYGAEVEVRGAICELAERTKENALRLLELRDNWKTPLLINLDYPQANDPGLPSARLEVSQLGFGLKLQLNLLVTSDMPARSVERELLRAILVEIIYRARTDIAPGTPYVAPPDWLLDGMLALEHGSDREENAQLLQSFVAENRITPLEEIVPARRAQLDAATRRLYAAYSQALLQLLLDAPGGRRKLVQYLHDRPDAPNDPVAELCAHFSETLGSSRARWWSLCVAQLSAADRYQILGSAETAALLDRLMHFSIPGPARDYSLGDYQSFRKMAAALPVLEQVGRQLRLLGARAHPLYRALVQEDYDLIELIAHGKSGDVSARLERVATHRAVVDRLARAIDDYLNWYEATQQKEMSGAFTEMLKPPEDDPSRRRDPISVYLDSIEMEMN